MSLAWSSMAALAIAPLQDLLSLGAESRMNVPGRASGNWRWRCQENMLANRVFDWLQELTETSKGAGASSGVQESDLGRESISVPLSGL